MIKNDNKACNFSQIFHLSNNKKNFFTKKQVNFKLCIKQKEEPYKCDYKFDCCKKGCVYSRPFKVNHHIAVLHLQDKTVYGYGLEPRVSSVNHEASYTGLKIRNPLFDQKSRRISCHKAYKGIFCSSCCTRVTPYWRDGWSLDVVLCNKCGLRYEKNLFKCPNCLFVPNKRELISRVCKKCKIVWGA